MTLPPKKITCSCGHVMELTQSSDWCTKCVTKVYYHRKDRHKNKLNGVYIVSVIVLVFGFLTYIFLEMIAGPLMILESLSK